MNDPIASLPMYDWPEVRPAMDAVWQRIRAALSRRGIDAPADLERRVEYGSVWREPGLVLSQTCGYPYVTALRGRVQLVATPCYRAPGCRGPSYRSFLLVRRQAPTRRVAELRGAVATVNSRDSQSGYSALRAVVAPRAGGAHFFSRVLASGSHRASMRMVAAGEADVCAIDAVCLALARRHEREAVAALRVLAPTPRAPSLPFVTAASRPPREVAAIRAALEEAIADPALATAREDLLIEGMEVLPDAAYERIIEIEQKAVRLGYPQVA